MPIYTCIYICIYICIETLRSVWVELYINICIQIYIYIYKNYKTRTDRLTMHTFPSPQVAGVQTLFLGASRELVGGKSLSCGESIGFSVVCVKDGLQATTIYIYTCICMMMIWKKIHCSCNIPEINPLNGVRLVGDVSLKWQTWKSSKNSKVRTDAFLDRSH